MHATLFPNTAPWMDPRKLLASGAAALLLLLNLHCGGGATATVPGPPPLTLTVEAPGEGVVVPFAALRLRGRVSQPSATVAINRQAVAVQADGAFEGACQLQEGRNTLTIEAWTETIVREGRGSGLLPPSERAEARVIRTVTYERPPLLLTVAVPAEGATFTTPTLQTTGVVSEPDATLTLNGQPVPLGPEGAFSATVDLQLGTNTFTYRATGAGQADRTATATRTVTRQAPPPAEGPTVTLAEPVEGTLTNAARIRVSGRVSDPTATLQVNGQPTPMDTAGAFSLDLAPPESPLTITAVATNAQGLTGSDRRSVVIDRTPPVITLARPVPALVNTRTLDLEGRVDDPTALLTLNAQGIPLAPEGAFQARYGLAEGPNHLAFRAVDPAGNVGTLERDTVCDSVAPVVRFLGPHDGFTTNDVAVTVRGTVDDPSASLVLQGRATALASDGSFEATLSAEREGVLAIRAEATDAAGHQGQATLYVRFDFTPPVLAWADPTPAEGSRLATGLIPAAVVLSESALTAINGQGVELEPGPDPAMPFRASAELEALEGQVVLTASAVDGAGNRATLTRALDVGLTAPRIQLESPVLDPAARLTTANPGATLSGRVLAPDFVRPLTFTVNGKVEALDAEGRFQVPVALAQGSNPFNLRAVSRFDQAGALAITILRTSQDTPPEDPVAVQIDWPQNGFASGVTPILVKGRVNKAGVQVTLAGLSVAVDPQTLQFSGRVPLTPGPNRIVALGRDADGRNGSAEVQGTYLVEGAAGYRWDHPVHGARSATRSVAVSGQADQPGILAVLVNGVPMSLSGEGAAGRFEGQVSLAAQGRNTLLLEVRTLAGEIRTEQREVIFEPELPRLRLLAPDAARPGEVIALQVAPEPGTRLVKADLSWNGRFLATVEEPFAPVPAQVPADAAVGGRIAVEALGTDAEGGTVTACSQVTVYGQGALMVEAFDDRLGLPFTDQAASAAVEGGERQTLDARGRAALATALPQNWVTVTKPGFTPVWRAAGLTVGSAQSVVDARLTPLGTAQPVDGSGASLAFAEDALRITLPSGAASGAGSLSATALSSQGLPALLPLGWSPLSAWWIQIDGAALAMPATASLNLPAATLDLPGDATFAWVRWDAQAHAWLVLAAPLSASGLGSLPLPAPGGYALVIADPAPTAPPTPVAGSVLPGFTGTAWHEGLPASGAVDPSLMPTVEAIRGARATARFELKFQDGFAVPSGAPIQADVLESYLKVDQALIEPEGFSQDAVATRWMLEVIDGKPALSGIPEGIGLRLPLRMSRSFGEQELVEGRIAVGFYHDGVQVAQSGTGLVGASGGTVSREGVSVTLPACALSGTALVRLSVEARDVAPLWPELAGKGLIVQSFQVDIVGTLRAGMGLSFEGLSLPDDARPLLVQRRVLRGQRLVLAVGGLQKTGSAWTLSLPPGGNALLEGGAFAVLLPDRPWDWISGTTTVPAALAQPLVKKLGAAAGLKLPPAARTQLSGSTGEEVAVADAVVEGDFLPAASGAGGAFAVPVALPAEPTQPVTLRAARRDLGVSGSLQAPAPSSGHTLRLAAVPFRVLSTVPAPGDTAPVATVGMILLSAPADPARLGGARLLRQMTAPPLAPSAPPKAKVQAPHQAKVAKRSGQKVSTSTSQPRLKLQAAGEPAPDGWVEVPVRRSLSQDGRTLLLTPENPLERGASYRLVAEGLASLAGEAAPIAEAAFTTAAVVQPPPVDFSRIKLGYPDATFNVPVTVPEGAIPPFAALEVEAPAMGSVFTGQMNPRGDLTFTLRASLGERLNIRVQLKDGRVFEGHLSRYEAADGTGRVTVGVDGGLVEAADGSCSVVLLAGAIDRPVEFVARFTAEQPEDLRPEVREEIPIFGRVQLLAREQVHFRKIPRIEMKAPEGTKESSTFKGFGPYAVCYRNTDFGPDGQPATFYEFLDTAQAEGGRLKSLGGLPWNRLEDEMPPDPPAAPAGELPVIRSQPRGPVRDAWDRVEQASAGPDEIKCYTGLSDFPLLAANVVFGNALKIELDGVIIKNPGTTILKGRAWTEMPDGTRYRTVRAPIFYSASGEEDVSMNGRYMSRTNECGSYMLMNAMWFDDPLQDSGALLCVEPDYGIKQVRDKKDWILWVTDKSNPEKIQKLYQIPGFKFQVKPIELEDHTAPWADAWFEGSDVLSTTEARANQSQVFIGVAGYDLQDNANVDLRVTLDGNVVCSGICQPDSARSKGSGKSNVWLVNLPQLSPGRHVVEVAVSDTAKNVTRIRKEITALDLGVQEPPVTPGVPPSFEIEVQGGVDAADPGISVRVVFSEPVTGVSPQTLVLNKVGAPPGQGWVSGVRLMGNAGEVKPDQRLHTVYLLPSTKLELGATYEVYGTGVIQDFNSPPLLLGKGSGLSKRFTVNKAQVLGQVAFSPRVMRADALGGRFFVATEKNQVAYLQVKDGTLTTPVTFGVSGSGGSDFLGQDITCVQTFRRVMVNQAPMDLLIVTTQPTGANHFQQGALWVFNACPGLQTPRPLFGMSIGQGATGYAPSVGCRDGVIAVGRLAGSVQLVDISIGMAHWNGDVSAVIQPQGHNTQAIIQPFYLADPDYAWQNGSTMGSHWSVAITPSQVTMDGKPALQVAVGYSHPGAQFRQTAMTGLPVFRLPYEVGKYLPMAPFVADGPSLEHSKVTNAPPASAYARPSGSFGGFGAIRIASWPRGTVMINGQAQTRDMVVGVSGYQPELKDVEGNALGRLGNSLLLADVTPEYPSTLGAWPAQPPFGPGVGYEILRKKPIVDELTGLVAVPVTNQKNKTVSWFVIDFKDPQSPKTVHMEPNLSSCGGFSNGILYGILYGIGGGKIVAKKVVEGIAGVDEGECYTLQARVEMAMDGNRTGKDELIGMPGSGKYLFWVNDDCDATSWKWDWGAMEWLLLDDDEKEGEGVYLTRPTSVTVPSVTKEPVVANYNDNFINGKRDLEDFTRLHIRIDGFTTSYPGVTYWMKFEGENPDEKPSINIVQAVNSKIEYLLDPSKALNQSEKFINGQYNPYAWILASVGPEESRLPNSSIVANGGVSPFLIEGASAGKGRLILMAKVNGVEIGRASVDLELKPMAEFWEKYVVTTTVADNVQQEAVPIGKTTYKSENDEYVLYVHGWNMEGWDTDGWEKDRWAETVFKRLWWLGYKGRVGGFQWPTLGRKSVSTYYDQSEFRAWRSSEALSKLLVDLNGRYPGQVRVIAHSMGNVVAGEAINLAPANVVHSYIATQAAIPAHIYDNRTPPLWDGPYNTPNVYGYYVSGQEPSRPYLEHVISKMPQGRLFNYYNTEDWALLQWKRNNIGIVNEWFDKPATNSGYFYEERDGNIDTYNPTPIGDSNLGDWFRSYTSVLTFPKDRYEIFAFCVQSRSNPLGAESEPVQGFEGRNLNKMPLIPEFGSFHVGHSRQFRSNLTDERGYWMWVGFDFKLQGFKKPGEESR